MKGRVLAIDVLRGMTIVLMIIVNTPGSWSYVYAPLLHAKWHGCTLTDLVFPSFLFTVGLSMFYSWKREGANYSLLIKKSIKRSIIIVLIGVLLTWFPFYNLNLNSARYFNVLQRIGLSFGLASILLYVFRSFKLRATVSFVILIVYTVIQTWCGDYSLPGNFNRHLDILLFGEAHLYGGFGIPFDPEGILGVLSSSAHIILGFLVANILNRDILNFPLLGLSIGVILAAGGLTFNFYIPINKPIWTMSYVFWTSGITTVILAGLIYIIDVKNIRRWTKLFKIFGINPLFCYVLSILIVKILLIVPIGDSQLYNWLYQNVFRPVFGNYNGSLGFAIFVFVMVSIPAYQLYRRKIYIKI